jgi:RHS repeat-associated protein
MHCHLFVLQQGRSGILRGETEKGATCLSTRSLKPPINPEGQRLRKAGGSTGTTYFAPDVRGALMAEYNGVWVDYVRLNGRLIGRMSGGQAYAVHVDQVGRPEEVTDSSRAVVWRAENYPFNQNVTLANITLNLGFPGQYYDAETRTWNNGYRDYISKFGRYLESDPVGLAGGVNTYAYVGGNPLSRVDPYGLWSVTITAIDGIGGAFVFGKDNQTGQWFWGGRIGLGVEDGVSLDPMGRRPGRDETPCHGTTVGTYIEAGVTVGPWTWNPVQGNAGVDLSTGDDYHEGPAAADTATMNNSPKYGLDIGGSIGGEVIYH